MVQLPASIVHRPSSREQRVTRLPFSDFILYNIGSVYERRRVTAATTGALEVIAGFWNAILEAVSAESSPREFISDNARPHVTVA